MSARSVIVALVFGLLVCMCVSEIAHDASVGAALMHTTQHAAAFASSTGLIALELCRSRTICGSSC